MKIYLIQSGEIMKKVIPLLILFYFGAIATVNSQPSATLTVSGIVTDEETGEKLAGISVLLKNSNKGTATDMDGKYSLPLNGSETNGTLLFSYVGYTPREVPIEKRSRIDVTLQKSISDLDEVVVIGYGTTQRRNITGAVSQVKATAIKDQAVTGFDQALVGKVAGVQVIQPNGAPGNSISVRVRGVGSISAGNEPLYVIDGVPLSSNAGFSSSLNSQSTTRSNPMNTINPNDIESIEVLKDAAASAIYGSRGSNGVVMITTKRGKSGAAEFSYDAFYGIQDVSKKIALLNAYQYAELTVEGINNSYLDAFPGADLDPALNDTRPVNYRIPERYFPYLEGQPGLTNTDWQDEIFQSAPMQNHTVSARGGTEHARYFISANYLDQQGIIITSGFKRYSGRVNVDASSGNFNFGMNFTPSYTTNDVVDAESRYSFGGIVPSALGIGPVFKVRNEDGSYNFDATPGEYSKTWNINPVALAELTKNQLIHSRVLANGYAEYKFLNSFTYRFSLGIDMNNYRQDFYRPSILPQMSGFGSSGAPAPSVAAGTSRTRGIINWVAENTLNYDRTINDHHINVLAGYTAQRERFDFNYLRADNFPNDLIETLNAGQITDGSSSKGIWSLISYLGRAQYNYKGKYLLSAALRADGSSRFGSDNKVGYFPSVSAGWVISDEGFFQNNSFLSYIKLRSSYGLTGNFQIPNYASYGLLNSSNYVSGNTILNGLSPSTVDNPNLGWEKTAMFNGGIDAEFINGRIVLQADYYNSNTSDLLLNVPVPLTSGFASQLRNIGKVNNSGIEFNVTYRESVGKLQFDINANIASNRNKVVALGQTGEPIYTNGGTGSIQYVTMIGKPIGSYYGRVWEGIIMNQQELESIPRTSSSKPGDFKFKDVNGDKMINDEDRTLIGSYFPDYIFGFTLNARLFNFDLSAAFQGAQGLQINNLQRRYIYNMEGNFNNLVGALNRWQSAENPGDGNTNRVNRVTTGQSNVFSSFHIEDGSYLRCRTVTLGYTLSNPLQSRLKMRNARIYCSLQNPFTITKYTGYNPEVDNRPESTLSPGEDYGTYPLSRTIVLGLNVTF